MIGNRASHRVQAVRAFCSQATSQWELWSWGRGAEGALGNGFAEDVPTPHFTGVAWAAADAPQLHAGMWHSGANVEGRLHMWGKGSAGRLGLGDEEHRLSPVSVLLPGAASRVHTMSLGGQHSAAIAIAPSDVIEDAKEPVSSVTSPPRLLTWGFGEFGALGHGGPQPEHFPCQVASLNQHLADAQQAGETQLKSSRVADAPAVSAGGTHTLVRDVRGRVFACGREDGDGRLGVQRRDLDGSGISSSLAQVDLPEPAVQIAAGGFASYALSATGQVWSWGSNSMGQRGTGTWGWSGAKPAVVQRIGDGRVALLTAGGFHAAALTHDGEVYTWGANKHGALGVQGADRAATPQRVAALRGVDIAQVACGPTSSAAISKSGELFLWGNNAGGILGLDTADTVVTQPMQAPGLGRVAAVALGAMHGLALVRKPS